MNSIGMASITAFYNVHTDERRRHMLPAQLSPRAVIVSADAVATACWPLCTPRCCPILMAYLSYNDAREVSETPWQLAPSRRDG
jgi:hypothetical protein